MSVALPSPAEKVSAKQTDEGSRNRYIGLVAVYFYPQTRDDVALSEKREKEQSSERIVAFSSGEGVCVADG